MAVDDFGIEVLKKAAEEVTSGSKSNYFLKTSSLRDLLMGYFNSLALPVVRWTRIVENDLQLDFWNVDFVQFSIILESVEPLNVSLDENNIFLLDSNTAFLLETDTFMELD